jgi:Prolipoprotein diacylglyceryl transferase
VLVFLGLALVTAVLAGRETLIYYHHEIAVLLAAAALAAVLGAPVAAQLDATAVGLGAFLAFGRLGCACASCCHGRPAHRWGVVYGREHVAAGLPPHFAGRPLVPLQVAEAVLVAALTAVAVAAGGEPGTAFGVYVTGYAVLRFGLEFGRGDAVRRYAAGLSEAQWTSLGVVAVLALLALAGRLAGPVAHGVAFLALAGWALVAVLRRRPQDWSPLDPRQAPALTARVEALAAAPGGAARVAATPGGIRLSAGRTGDRLHFTCSRAGRALSDADAAELAAIVAEVTGDPAPECVNGVAGTRHLLVTRS